MVLQKIIARQIYDSRGNPTVEVDLTTDKGETLYYNYCQALFLKI